MHIFKRLTALLLALLTVSGVSVFAEEAEEETALVQRSELLDVAFTMLEAGNPFLEAYNEITGAAVEPYFELGLPYFFGGKHDQETKSGELLVFSHAPLYAKRQCWETTHFYRKNAYYLYGFDCSGYTQWIYSQVGWPKHDKLDAMINQYGKYGKKNHVYSHRKGKEMPPYNELASTLQIGDLLVGKHGARHIMMFIGTLREFGFTAETVPELAEYLDYTLVIHCGPHPDYGERMQQFLDAHADDSYYDNVKVPNGGVTVSIIGVPLEAAPHHGMDGEEEYYWFELPDGTKLTIWDLEGCTSFCWFRINGI